jgi:sortase A
MIMQNLQDRIVTFLRGHRAARVGISGLTGLLLLGAVALLGYPFFTNIWQSRVQSRLAHQLASDPALSQEFRTDAVPIGDSLTRLEIPSIGVDVVVVEGTTDEALKAGAGHYPSTPLPCEEGDVAVAGHRTTYGRPFADVDRLRAGDRIVLTTPVGRCVYQVAQAPFVVLPTDTAVVADTPGRYTLTLTSCTPKGSASHRIIVKAAMVSGPSPAPAGSQPQA